MEFTRTEPVLEEKPTESTAAPTTHSTTAPTIAPSPPVEKPEKKLPWGILGFVSGVVVVLLCIVRHPGKKRGGKYLKR